MTTVGQGKRRLGWLLNHLAILLCATIVGLVLAMSATGVSWTARWVLPAGDWLFGRWISVETDGAIAGVALIILSYWLIWTATIYFVAVSLLRYARKKLR